MYGYATTFILIFMTHPGVVYTFFDPGISSAIAHATTVVFLQSASEGRPSGATTIEILYWVLFFVWIYVKIRMALMGGVTSALSK
jgi:hypothetical protein